MIYGLRRLELLNRQMIPEDSKGHIFLLNYRQMLLLLLGKLNNFMVYFQRIDLYCHRQNRRLEMKDMLRLIRRFCWQGGHRCWESIFERILGNCLRFDSMCQWDIHLCSIDSFQGPRLEMDNTGRRSGSSCQRDRLDLLYNFQRILSGLDL